MDDVQQQLAQILSSQSGIPETSEFVPYAPQPQIPAMEILDLMRANSDKNFVNRALNAGVHPMLYDNPNGQPSTHSMAMGQVDDKSLVYPTVVQRPGEQSLTRMNAEEALRYALQTGEYMSFDNPNTALSVSKDYKQIPPNYFLLGGSR